MPRAKPRPRRAPDETPPTPQRLARGDVGPPTQRLDAAGRLSAPRPVKDSLTAMRDAETIDDHQLAAALRFRDDFARARLDPLRARALADRVSGGRHAASDGRDAASERVHLALERVGGPDSPPGLALWWVVGAELSIAEFCRRIAWRGRGPLKPHTAAGLVIAGLSSLVAFYGIAAARLRSEMRAMTDDGVMISRGPAILRLTRPGSPDMKEQAR